MALNMNTRFGVRDICHVVLRAKGTQKIGNKVFYKDEPVCYFETLKSSSLEGAATTVYATGGSGNTRLMSWDGERTMTFTMEDALISPMGLMILSGAGLISATDTAPIKVHTTEYAFVDSNATTTKAITIEGTPVSDELIYVMAVNDKNEVLCEPFLYKAGAADGQIVLVTGTYSKDGTSHTYAAESADVTKYLGNGQRVIVDYYANKTAGYQIDIDPDQFGGNFYLEGETLWKDRSGLDYPAEFIIPNCRVQSNFTFTMAAEGDPSTFTFTLDAFPGIVKGGKDEVLAAIQIIDTTNSDASLGEYRAKTEALTGEEDDD